MTTIPIPTNLTSSYAGVYDAWNRLISLSSGGTTIATYSYDGLSRRIVKGIYAGGTLDHNEHAYYNETGRLMEVRKEVGGVQHSNPLEQYVWHPAYIDAPILRDYDATTSGAPTRYYYTLDSTFNVTALTSSSGAPVEPYYYSPYGHITFLDGSFNILSSQKSQAGNSVTYTGRQLDAESGLYYYRARYYHAEAGQFIARDPVTYYANRMNLYEYVDSNPTNFIDPFGTKTINTFGWKIGIEGGYGKGVGVSITLVELEYEYEPCPTCPTCPTAEFQEKATLKFSASAFAGLEFKINVGPIGFGFSIRMADITVQTTGSCILKPCRGEPPCCKSCGSVSASIPRMFGPESFELGGKLGIGISLKGTAQITASLNVCYDWPRCPHPGFAAGLCLTWALSAEVEITTWGINEFFKANDSDKQCIMALGSQDML